MSVWVDHICAVCKRVHHGLLFYDELYSDDSYFDLKWLPQLDGRRGMTGEIFDIESCACGYTSPNISVPMKGVNKAMLKSGEFKEIEEDSTLGKAKIYIVGAKLMLLNGYYLEAGNYFLQATWFLEDNKDARSQDYRLNAILCYREYLNRNEDLRISMRMLDVIRRYGDFEEAERELINLEECGVTENFVPLLKFQRTLIENRDKEIHYLSECGMDGWY